MLQGTDATNLQPKPGLRGLGLGLGFGVEGLGFRESIAELHCSSSPLLGKSVATQKHSVISRRSSLEEPVDFRRLQFSVLVSGVGYASTYSRM